MEYLRPLMITYAYNLLGIVEEAEDIVQDVFLKFSQIGQENIADKRAYMLRMVINFSINRKKKLKNDTVYYGNDCLPELVATERTDNNILKRENLSATLAVLQQTLNAKERAVFILREAYDYEHAEIAKALDITSDLSRKLLSRAKTQLNMTNLTMANGGLDKVSAELMGLIEHSNIPKLERSLRNDIFIPRGGYQKKWHNPKTAIA